MDKLKIIFVGTPDMAIICLDNLLKNNFDIVGVVPPLKDNISYRAFKNFSLDKKLNFLEFENSPNEEKFIEKIKSINADIGVVCSYNIKLSSDFLKTTKQGFINCHPSLLPDYRGGMPYFHIIKNNEKKSGITLHFMDENFDTGDIIYQESFEISPFETMGTLFNKTNFMISDALCKTLKNIENNEKIERISQNKTTKFKKAPIVNGYFKINWNSTIDDIDALIRACNPFYTVYCYFRGAEMKIIKAHKIFKNHNHQYGEIIKTSKKEILIAAPLGYISLDVVQVGTWGVFVAEDFCSIFKPLVGEILK